MDLDRPIGIFKRAWWNLRRPFRLWRMRRDGLVPEMQRLAAKGDEEYRRAFRQACFDVLGEDPEEDWA